MSLNLSVILRESAFRYPDREAIVLGEKSFTYRSLFESASEFAGALRGLEVHPGQHIAIMLPNVPQFTIAYFGGHMASTPIVPLNVLLKSDEIAYHLEDSDAVALVVWEDFFEQAKSAVNQVAGCKHLIVVEAKETLRKETLTSENIFALSELLESATPIT